MSELRTVSTRDMTNKELAEILWTIARVVSVIVTVTLIGFVLAVIAIG